MSFRSNTLRFAAAILIGVCLASCVNSGEPRPTFHGTWKGTTTTGLTIEMGLAESGGFVTGNGAQTDSGSSSSSALTISGLYINRVLALVFKRPGAEDLSFSTTEITATSLHGTFGSGLAMTFIRQ